MLNSVGGAFLICFLNPIFFGFIIFGMDLVTLYAPSIFNVGGIKEEDHNPNFLACFTTHECYHI